MDQPEKNRDYKLRKRYGITLQEYNDILAKQNKKCAICGRPAESFSKNLSVDHNHQSGFVRGLLCQYCNSMILKYLRDNKRIAVGLVKYLEVALRLDQKWNYQIGK